MSPITIPKPRIDERAEEQLYRLVSPGLEPNRWRPDFDEWAKKRIWAECHQERLLDRLERHVLGHRCWSGMRVLDLGTGRGGLSVVLRLGGARVTALDLRRRNCRILKLRAERYGLTVPAVRAVGEYLPFEAGSFDLVICKDVTEHCREPQRVLTEIARVLAPNGKAYVTFINRLAWVDPHYHLRGVNFLPRRLAEIVIGLTQRRKANARDMQRLSDMHYYTLAAARQAAHAAGLEYDDLTFKLLKDRKAGALRCNGHRFLSLGAGTFESVLAPVARHPPPA
jgi:2-polyprenyl-3-methyl-5-hydroxy-6-metoxy-1,4-benzoquinol methylase